MSRKDTFQTISYKGRYIFLRMEDGQQIVEIQKLYVGGMHRFKSLIAAKQFITKTNDRKAKALLGILSE